MGAEGTGYTGIESMAAQLGLETETNPGTDVGWIRSQLEAGNLVAVNGNRSVTAANEQPPFASGSAAGGHWIAVTGMTPEGNFIVKDPSTTCKELTPAELERFLAEHEYGGFATAIHPPPGVSPTPGTSAPIGDVSAQAEQLESLRLAPGAMSLEESGFAGQGEHILAMAEKYDVPVDLAMAMLDAGRFAEGLPVAKAVLEVARVLTLQERLLGTAASLTLRTREDRAGVLLAAGRAREALSELEGVLAAFEAPVSVKLFPALRPAFKPASANATVGPALSNVGARGIGPIKEDPFDLRRDVFDAVRPDKRDVPKGLGLPETTTAPVRDDREVDLVSGSSSSRGGGGDHQVEGTSSFADLFEPGRPAAGAGAAIREAAMDIVNSRGPRAERDEGRGSGDGDGDSGGGGGDHGAPGLDVAGGTGLPGGLPLPGSVLSTGPVSL